MQIFGDVDILTLVRISQVNWIDNVNRMDSKRSRVFNNNPQRSQLTGWPKNRWWNCLQILCMQNYKLELEIKEQNWLGEVH